MMMFWTVTSGVYLAAMSRLADEVRDLPPQQRREAKTLPMMLACTVLYFALASKLPLLEICCGTV